MAVKSRTIKPVTPAATSKPLPDMAAVDAIVDSLADRPYGTDKPPVEKARPLTISLSPSLIIQLEDAALANKRSGKGPKTASAIIREGLAAIGFVE